MWLYVRQLLWVGVLSGILSACHTNISKPDPMSFQTVSQAKGEWSLLSLAHTHDFDLSQLRYRISLRIVRQEFSLAAPCTRLLGQYHSTQKVLRFQHFENRPINCNHSNETPTLKQLLQQTQRYVVHNDTMFWHDANGRVLAVWQRIYL